MAIAFDTAGASTAYGASVSSITWNHTTTGTDLLLVVCIGEDRYNGNVNPITTVTYNGVSMTKQGQQLALTTDNFASIWYLLAPATGSHAILASTAGGNIWEASGCSTSYTGVKQTGFPDASASSTYSSGTAPSISVTPIASGTWLIAGIGNRGGSKGAGANTTLRAAETGNNQSALFDGGTATTTTLNMTQSTNSGLGIIGFTVAPSTVTTSTAQLLVSD